jgi:DNA (cytosine-5)-methyltransferase 1
MLKVGTDFSGIGSPELALRNLGVEHESVFACDKDKYARQTFLANFHPKFMFEDVTTRDNSNAELDTDLYIAGFPCQAFSLSGKRLGFEDVRGTLFFNSADYIRKRQPRFFILENVKGLLSHDRPKGSKAKHGRTFQTIINLLGETVNGQMLFSYYEDHLNYNLHYKVLNTKDYGIPQNRERVFLVGIRSDLPNTFQWPKSELLTKRLKDILEVNVDPKYFLSDKMCDYLLNRKGNFNGGKINLKEGDDVASTITSSSSRLDISDNIIIDEKKSRSRIVSENADVSPTLLANQAKQSTDSIYIQEEIDDPMIGALRGRDPENPSNRKKGANLKQTLEINENGLCNTLTSVNKDNLVVHSLFPRTSKLPGGNGYLSKMDGTTYCVNTTNKQAVETIKGRIRKLTPLECFRLQGFPDDFVKPCSDSQLYKQAGNSISETVIRGVIKNLLQV